MKKLAALVGVISILILLSSCSLDNCAKEGEEFSPEVSHNLPKHCCKGLEEWDSGMDTSIPIGDECYETGAMSGSLAGTCINCGNGICEDIENPCNCLEDCAGGKNSRFLNVEEFCGSSPGKRLMEECSFGMDLPVCELC